MTKRTSDRLLIFLIVLVVLCIRRYDAFTNAQFWAEDGTIFFQQSVQLGFASIFKPYNGYIHFIPRCVASFWTSIIPLSYYYIPLAYNITTFFITYAIALCLYATAVRMGMKNKVLYATFFLLMPIGSEMFMNITNVLWLVAVYLLNYVYENRDLPNRGERFFSYFILGIMALTGTASLMMAPPIALIFFLERKQMNTRRAIPLFIIMACGIIQLVLIKFVNVRQPVGHGGAVTLIKNMYNTIRGNTIDVFYLYLFNAAVRPRYITIVAMGLVAGFIFIFVKAYRKVPSQRKLSILLYSVAFFMSALLILNVNDVQIRGFNKLHETAQGWSTSERYMYMPYICLVWFVIIAYDKRINSKAVIICLAFIAFHLRELNETLPDKDWKGQIQQYYEGKRTEMDINPRGWKVVLPQYTSVH